MAYVSTSKVSAISPAERFRALVQMAQRAIERRRVYAQTIHELDLLTDRELNDLGIHRSSIRSVALEAAYGPN